MDLELVSCSGYGKNGALSVLQVLHIFIACYDSHSQFDIKGLENVFTASPIKSNTNNTVQIYKMEQPCTLKLTFVQDI